MTGHDGALLGIIHRDISPQNVLLSVDGAVKLLDFGIAKARGRAERTEAGVIKGKVRYMAPEQAAGNDIDRRIDIYALGVVLWEMLTMRRYIEGKSEIEVLRKVQAPTPVPPGSMVEGIAPETDAAVMRALAPAITGRPSTAEALARELAVAVPDGVVGPAHVAELLRLFVADEIAAATKALPAEVSAPIAASIAASIAAAERIGVDDSTRIATLTSRVEPKEVRAEATGTPSPDAVGPATPGAPGLGEHPSLASDEGDDEPTVMDSEGEIAALFDAHRDAPRPASPAPRAEEPAAVVEEEPRRGVLGWTARILLLTVVAFAIGAVITTVWVRFHR
jgi:serine/threonine-protein kinase